MRRRLWFCTVLAVLPLTGCTAAPSPTPTPAPRAALVAFDSCTQLDKELRAAAPRIVVDRRPRAAPGEVLDQAAAPAPAAAAHSTTNVHEIGADEPDIVKTDGRRIVTVDRGVLRVIDPVARRQTGRLDLGGAGSELLLAGDRALVLLNTNGYGAVLDDRRLLPPTTGRAEVVLVDLAGSPTVISRYRGDGRLLDARQTGSVARVVLATRPRLPQSLNATDADAWRPRWEITTGTKTATGQVDCRDVVRPPSYSATAMLTLLTFDLNAPVLSDGDPLTVVSDGDAVYGTATSLYVTNNQYRNGGGYTEIFKFGLPGAAKPVLEAGGQVPGSLLNQYAMSEWDHHLRVATTDDRAGTSAVRVLAVRDGKLVPVGEVDGLGRGERIYAVRFIGPRGYVVTFRQTDPLYSLDLSDPARPRVTGELKITGYSAHLQPVGADRLIGIGQEADTTGVRQGLQVSLFDVADPAQPRRLAQEVLPGARSMAEFDPHALLWWPATRLLVVPVSGLGSLAVRVDDTGLREAAHAVAGEPVRRTLVVGDELWTLTESGLTVADLSTLDQVGRLPFS